MPRAERTRRPRPSPNRHRLGDHPALTRPTIEALTAARDSGSTGRVNRPGNAHKARRSTSPPIRRTTPHFAACMIVAACLATGSAAATAQIYSNAPAADHAVVLSNFQSELTPELLLAAPQAATPAQVALVGKSGPAPKAALPALRLPAAPSGLHALIDEVAAQVKLSPRLLHAVIAAESGYDSRALSPRGAIGLMQLMPATARRFGVHDAYRPRDNLLAGASYLKWLLSLFHDDLELALAAYNAGEQAVINAGRRIPPYPETQAYVPRVLAYLHCANDASCGIR